MSEEIIVWGIHNTNNENLLLQDEVIAIGWHEMGDLSTIDTDRESYYKAYDIVYPNKSKQSIAGSA